MPLRGQSNGMQIYHPHKLCHPPGKTEGRLCFVLDRFIAQTKDSHTLRIPALERTSWNLDSLFSDTVPPFESQSAELKWINKQIR